MQKKHLFFTLLSSSLLLAKVPFDSRIGAHPIPATSLSKNALIAAPQGKGHSCSLKAPCQLDIALKKLKSAQTLFLKGGEYPLKTSLIVPVSGTKECPLIIESFPHEHAILNGHEDKESIKKGGNIVRNGIHIQGKKYIKIRNIEVKNMGARGINLLYSSHITVEGCIIHGNHLSGITIYGGNDEAPYSPYKYGYNLLENNIIYDNSDAGLSLLQKQEGHTYSYEEGDNADGISISSGKFNRVIHNTVYANSDDGIDTWRSNNSYVGYNLVFDNGRGKAGNGNGIKAGGNRHFDNQKETPNGKLAIIEHNIAAFNKYIGFNINSGKKVTYLYNTAWKNGAQGFTSYDDTRVENNLASHNAKPTITRKNHHHNSWQQKEKIPFINTDIKRKDFLRPNKPIMIGAYASKSKHKKIPLAPKKKKAHIEKLSHIFLIGDSTVHNTSRGEAGWGDALSFILKSPKHLHNLAQSGASTQSYMHYNATQNNWSKTLKEIAKYHAQEGDYLLIQFGHNNKHKTKKEQESFEKELHSYVQEAKRMHLTPVLITPPARLWKYDATQGNIPNIVRKVAQSEGITLLDLHQKSTDIFNHYKSHDALAHAFGYDDHTHFNPKAAKIVANWIKELACQKEDALCAQFK